MGLVLDPLRLCLAIGPLSLYLLVLGWINLSRRPRVVSGARDLAALAVGVSGLLIVGPMELFLPQTAAARFGPAVWALVLALYTLVVVLIALGQRPRLTVYNMPAATFRGLFAGLIAQLDAEGNWQGEVVHLPGLDLQLRVVTDAPLRNVSLAALGQGQSLAGWRRLERSLAAALATVQVPPNPRGVPLVLLALAMLLTVALELASQGQSIAAALVNMLRMH